LETCQLDMGAVGLKTSMHLHCEEFGAHKGLSFLKSIH
jgi:hypothetical protein